MLVVVAVVRGVPVTVVDVVDVVAVRDGHVAAALTVPMFVLAVHGVPGRLALVDVVAVDAVQVSVVDVVGVVTVRNRDVTAAGPVDVVVLGVRMVLGCRHRTVLPRAGWAPAPTLRQR
ncbi:hypothetical protein GCM10023094_10920 [Rhodococcus olei]|uniref:Secreted protein n=1 Tax=Rhodococcus olei TaxID=2161675 RepID=A0ABP8NVC1_9NOCA